MVTEKSAANGCYGVEGLKISESVLYEMAVSWTTDGSREKKVRVCCVDLTEVAVTMGWGHNNLMPAWKEQERSRGPGATWHAGSPGWQGAG